MKKILLFLSVIILCSCSGNDYVDWEVHIKYNLISGQDTIYLEDTDTISYHISYAPTVTLVPDSSAIIVRFMNDKGSIPEFEKTHNYKTERKSKIVYQHCIPKLNTKLGIVEFTKRKIRYKKVSGFDGQEIVPDTNMTVVPVI